MSFDAVYTDTNALTQGARQQDDIALMAAKINEGWKPARDLMI